MRLAPEGRPQILVSTLLLAVGVWGTIGWFWPAVAPMFIVWAWSISFFRDPRRSIDSDPAVLCSPADGTIQDIERLADYPPIEGPAVRVGIFLSLFNVHVNRSPCAGTVRSVEYRRGKFLAAMNPLAGESNESNTIVIETAGVWPGPVVVRQIAGMAARRIVCHARQGSVLGKGERFGLIKFGSRTELIVPLVADMQVLLQVGDRVKAGETRMIRCSPIRKGREHAANHQDVGRPQTAASA